MAPLGGVVEISSDEEDFPAGNKLPIDPLGWASGLLDADDDAIGDDFDDLMVMSEWSSPPVLQKISKPDDLVIMSELSSPPVPQKKARPGGGLDEEDDDDCVVLDGDPDKAVTVAEEEGSAGDGSSDELLIVAEKGPIACRDFPHPRHLCSNLPFSTTSHVKHCSMCHCFVCDAPAPCTYWGNGTTVADHCHATDKETKWKTLRQALKCKSLPSSGPQKHQNVMYSTVTSPRQRAQALQCQVAVAKSLLSSVSNPSLATRRPLPNGVSQNQQRHPPVRVPMSVPGTVSIPRAGRSIGNSYIAQNAHSRAIFKRVGGVPPGPTTNANQFGSAAAPDNSLMHQASKRVQVAPRTNAFIGTARNNPPLRSFSAPITFHAQEGQPAAYCQVASNGMNVIGPQLSRCCSLTAQGTQCLEEPVIDVCTQSWEDILASVASDMGVPDYDISTAESQHVPVDSTASPGLGLQNESVAAMENLTSSHVHDLSNHTTGAHVQADVPLQATVNLHHLNSQSSPVPKEVHLNSSASNSEFASDGLSIKAAQLERPVPNEVHLNSSARNSEFASDGLSMEAAQLEIARLESAILFEFDFLS